jgi:hypothetical protein
VAFGVGVDLRLTVTSEEGGTGAVRKCGQKVKLISNQRERKGKGILEETEDTGNDGLK